MPLACDILLTTLPEPDAREAVTAKRRLRVRSTLAVFCGDCCRFAPKGRVRFPTFPKPYLRFHRRGACRDESIWQLRPSVRPVGLGPGGAGLARPARAALAVISTRGIARAIAGYDARPVAGGGQHLSWLIKTFGRRSPNRRSLNHRGLLLARFRPQSLRRSTAPPGGLPQRLQQRKSGPGATQL